jgi:hypothetical protein
MWDNNENWTPDATLLDCKVHDLLAPIVSEFIGKGYNVREIIHVMTSTVVMLESETIVRRRMDERKRKENSAE